MNIPPRSINGGWFTGEQFPKGAPYGSTPVIPDTGYLIHYNLRSANPPPDAIFQYPGTERPGNNTAVYPGVDKVGDGKYGLACNKASCQKQHSNNTCKCNKCAFKKYAYWT
jgi:hypothetical protein